MSRRLIGLFKKFFLSEKEEITYWLNPINMIHVAFNQFSIKKKKPCLNSPVPGSWRKIYNWNEILDITICVRSRNRFKLLELKLFKSTFIYMHMLVEVISPSLVGFSILLDLITSNTCKVDDTCVQIWYSVE